MGFFQYIILFSVVFWNLENYFDCVDSGYSSSDREFSARGTRHWSRKKFDAKTAMIGKTLLWCEQLPSVVGVAEVENSRVMKNLVYSEVLHKCPYRYVHYDSHDPRGIDVAMMYLGDEWEEVLSYPVKVMDGNGAVLRTRDILYVCLRKRSDGEVWHFFVNHHPSKYGGASSSGRRVAAMRALKNSVDSLLAAGQGNIVAMGDFNDTPSSEAFSLMDGTLVNMGKRIEAESSGTMHQEGTIRFHGNWQIIDNFLISPDVDGRMHILKPPFIMERDRQYPGEKPRRTYIGPRYNGGVSDHLPIMLDISL